MGNSTSVVPRGPGEASEHVSAHVSNMSICTCVSVCMYVCGVCSSLGMQKVGGALMEAWRGVPGGQW